MFVKKNFSLKAILRFAGHHFIWLLPLVCVVAFLQIHLKLTWLELPWQPVTIIGTAVAFYLGFKNNQSYDRLWEARKVWGAIVNSSRAWGSTLRHFATDQFVFEDVSEKELESIRKRMIYRHIGWLYALRSQLLIPAPWEHVSQKGMIGRFAKRRNKQIGVGLFSDDITDSQLDKFLPEDEHERLVNAQNTATQIIDQQSADLKEMRKAGVIDDFRHMELQKLLYDFYIHQGKLERIKGFPLPRQYGSMSFIFVAIFICILPFGVIPLFKHLGDVGIPVAIFSTCLVAWVYLVMELVGDYSENPFEGGGNDIPMYAICRTIEIDLKEMLGEKKLPKKVKAKKGVLM